MQTPSARRRRSISDVPPSEVPWHWSALTLLLLGVALSAVIRESAVHHRVPSKQADIPLIDINYGSQEELESLPGIGPALARTIIGARAFASPDDLIRVPGVGPKLLARLRPLIKASQGRRTADLR